MSIKECQIQYVAQRKLKDLILMRLTGRQLTRDPIGTAPPTGPLGVSVGETGFTPPSDGTAHLPLSNQLDHTPQCGPLFVRLDGQTLAQEVDPDLPHLSQPTARETPPEAQEWLRYSSRSADAPHPHVAAPPTELTLRDSPYRMAPPGDQQRPHSDVSANTVRAQEVSFDLSHSPTGQGTPLNAREGLSYPPRAATVEASHTHHSPQTGWGDVTRPQAAVPDLLPFVHTHPPLTAHRAWGTRLENQSVVRGPAPGKSATGSQLPMANQAAASSVRRPDLSDMEAPVHPVAPPLHAESPRVSPMAASTSQGSKCLKKDTCPLRQAGGLEGDNPVSELERRQESILERLNALKQEVDQLSRDSGIPLVDSHSVSTTPADYSNQSGVVQDIVVNADPDCPPLSLFIVLHQLSQRYRVLTTAYVHSSVQHIRQPLRDVFLNGHTAGRNEYQYAVSLVWKKDEWSPSMMIEPHKQAPIVGEANIARFLCRLLTPSYDNGDPVQTTVIDNWLDVATHQLLNGNSKEKSAAVRNLNSRLGNNQWLASNSLSLADIVMWSALNQSGQANDLPANVKEWFKSCSNLPSFQLAKSLC